MNGEKGNVLNQKTEWPLQGSQASEEVERISTTLLRTPTDGKWCELLFIRAQVKDCCLVRM
jgi:hypothetical protein